VLFQQEATYVTTQAQLPSDEAKQVVLNLGTAINDESFQTARIYVADDMKYERVACCRHLKVPFLHQVRQLLVTYVGGIRHLQSLEGI
jgi:hypothetical protein